MCLLHAQDKDQIKEQANLEEINLVDSINKPETDAPVLKNTVTPESSIADPLAETPKEKTQDIIDTADSFGKKDAVSSENKKESQNSISDTTPSEINNLLEEPKTDAISEKVAPSETKTAVTPSAPEAVKMTGTNEVDDLQSLKEDIGEALIDQKNGSKTVVEDKQKYDFLDTPTTENDEKLLKELAQHLKNKVANSEWWELGRKSDSGKYEVQKGEDLISISKKLFGTETYYSKIWALNPQITNPYDVEAGTVLSFNMGSSEAPPDVKLGEFSQEDDLSEKLGSASASGENAHRPDWIKERKKLIDQGIYFQFASEETYDDLINAADEQKVVEFENYSPPISNFAIQEPTEQYDKTGFSKNSKIIFNYKEGFFLNSFLTTNVVQDLGEIKHAVNEGMFIHKLDTVFVSFNKSAKVKPGDIFSAFTSGGEITHRISDRSGFLYTTTAQLKVVKPLGDVWECLVIDQSGVLQRNDHVTVYTPRIGKVFKTYGKRKVEAAIIGSYRESTVGLSFGDVVYLDRGRVDGLELGNTLDIYSFVDRGTSKRISQNPAYLLGELNIINLTDNFATAIISASRHEIGLGAIAFVKTQEDAIRDLNKAKNDKTVLSKNGKALDELDVELNLDDVNQDILNKADRIQLTEDEIQELDKQEKDKSIVKDKERDITELDRLETEILGAEKSLHESKVDEDKFLEQQSLEDQEKKSKAPSANAFESINEIEKDIGKKYLDEDLNNKENPFGLTEYDLEEVDLLLNTGSKK